MTPLLVCDVGPYALRRRPLLLGIPLERAAGVVPMREMVPFPGGPPELLGLATIDRKAVPVYSATRLLGLSDPPSDRAYEAAPQHLVLLRTNGRTEAVAVVAASDTDRPLHLAPAGGAAPARADRLAGLVTRRDGWILVLDPERLPA